MNEQGWLRSVQVVDTPTMGDETGILRFIREVLESGIYCIVELGVDQTLNDQEVIQ